MTVDSRKYSGLPAYLQAIVRQTQLRALEEYERVFRLAEAERNAKLLAEARKR